MQEACADMISFDQISVWLLVFSLFVTVILLGWLAFTSPRSRRQRKH